MYQKFPEHSNSEPGKDTSYDAELLEIIDSLNKLIPENLQGGDWKLRYNYIISIV